MKICAIICEYNPLHKGHAYLIERAKALSGANSVLCVMSGNFVQRGDAAVLDKFTRAKHAVWGGADAVIELPVPFATANAELFAKGAIKLLSSIPEVEFLCFGVESATEAELLRAATLMNDEPLAVSEKLRALMATGLSYAKARAESWKGILPNGILNTPNNVLAVEYARAVLAYHANVRLLPVKRVGGGYLDDELCGELSSATAIRNAVRSGVPATESLPPFVDTKEFFDLEARLNAVKNYAVLNKTTAQIAEVLDCSEGLENALKKAVLRGENNVATALTSTRYTRSRINRILLQNALNVTKKDVFEYLSAPLYLRLLGVKKESEEVLSALGNAAYPLLARPRDESVLKREAKRCFETDKFAEMLYAILTEKSEKKIELFI